MAQLVQLGAHFEVIVDFSVEHDDRVAVFGRDGLIAVLQINDFQARGAHRAYLGLVNTKLVWSPVDQGRGGVPNAIRRWRPIFMSKTDNAAQIDQSLDSE
jgi:glycogen debranching enzyme